MRSRALHLAVAAVAAAALVVVGASPPSGAQATPRPEADRFTVTPLEATSRTEGAKAPTSRVAASDPDLIARTDTTPVPVVVKLDYDSIATYEGGRDGLAATSPAVTGRSLTDATATRSAYAREVARQEAEITADITAAVPEARIGRSFRVVYGGVAAVVPANRAKDLLSVPGVVAVQEDTLNQPLTDSSTEFIDAPAVWDQVGGQATAGEGILFGSLDSGLWPEHPSFAANPDLPARPTRPDGRALECDFGDDPLTPATDVFECTNKLVGGSAFIDTYLLVNGDEDEVYPDSARDSNGHGTHTASTVAGGVVDEAPVFGVDRGPISGVAPGAWVMGYKVCGAVGCYGSDTTGAVEAAILDGVDVINYSISGGTTPFTDSTELAFLDAYAAGVYVSTSAGNEGPGASTANHLSPWTTSVAASTQLREFGSDLSLTAGSDTFTASGVSIGSGIAAATPVVLAQDVPGYTDPTCAAEPPEADTFDGLIVGCARGNPAGRVASGYSVFQGGGEGMVLYNVNPGSTMTDNHWLPVVHLPAGTGFEAFVDTHPGVTGTFTAGISRDGVGDVVADFSSRGPAGDFLKPDVTAPGVQILAGTTPTPESIVEGPPGEYFQAIAGTSMSAPHVAGSGILMLAEHPGWTPGQVRSALMTTATTELVKEDGETAADPFDIGAGRIDLGAARAPGLTLDETARRFLTLSASPTDRIDLNIPSVNAPTMPGEITTTRTFTNVGGSTATYAVSTTAGEGSTITVSPSRFTVAAGASRTVEITIASTNTEGQEFGEIRLAASGRETLHLPVAFAPSQGGATVTSDCDDATVAVGATTTCTVTATNDSFGPTVVEGETEVNDRLRITDAEGATVTSSRTTEVAAVELTGRSPGTPSMEPLGFDGYLDLNGTFGIPFDPIGDEEIVDFGIDPFVYNGIPYDAIGVDSNGYIVAGGSSGSADNVCCPPQELPNVLPPNNVIAPFWSDLDGTDAPGIIVVELTDTMTGDAWTVIEWQVNAFGTETQKTFQVWLGHQAEQDITLNYPPADIPDLTDLGEPLVVGVENETGAGGESLVDTPPTEDIDIVSTDAIAGAAVSWSVEVQGHAAGAGDVRSEVTATGMPGTTVVHSAVAVTGEDLEQLEAFVDRAYQDILGYPADQAGREYWAGRIQSGSMSRSSFAFMLSGNDRWLRPIVTGRYEQFVDREPSTAEADYWVGELRAGRPESLLAAQLIGSEEFFAAANREVDAFVDQAYLAVLGRLPDDAGKAYWVDRIEDGMSRSMVGKTFFQVPENRANRANAQSDHFLDRAPSGAEATAWSEILRTQTDRALTAAIVGSDAYFALDA
ncbi:MAG TPA: S8 family serine peptidase [Iamia sp.]